MVPLFGVKRKKFIFFNWAHFIFLGLLHLNAAFIRCYFDDLYFSFRKNLNLYHMSIEKFMDVAQCVHNITNYYSGFGKVIFITATYYSIVKTKRTKTLIKNMADLCFLN